MPMEQLSIGYPHTLVVGTVYALPSLAVWARAQGGTVEVSNDNVTFAAIDTTRPVTARFIRTTVANSILVLQKV